MSFKDKALHRIGQMEDAPTQYLGMFDHLDVALRNLDEHLDADGWNTMDVTYHPPHVERLWKDIQSLGEPVRLFLHRIHPCEPGEALWHPHPWPSAVKLIDGEYEHGVGFKAVHEGGESLNTACTTVLTKGARYEMVEPTAWHYVRPLKVSHTVMVCGAPYKYPIGFPKPEAPQGPLDPATIIDLKTFFEGAYDD